MAEPTVMGNKTEFRWDLALHRNSADRAALNDCPPYHEMVGVIASELQFLCFHWEGSYDNDGFKRAVFSLRTSMRSFDTGSLILATATERNSTCPKNKENELTKRSCT
jgi:hypothetical protein